MLNRRKLIYRSLLLAVGASSQNPIMANTMFSSQAKAADAHKYYNRLAGVFPDARGIDAVGQAYLGEYKDNPDVLLDLIASRLDMDGDSDRGLFSVSLGEEKNSSTQRLAKRLMACVTEEFNKGETVEVQGWILARTEAQVCAVLAKKNGRL